MAANNIICVIPARYSSKRLPGKPLAVIKGKPLVQWVYECAVEAKVFDCVCVATDDKRILETVEKFGGTAAMTSPTHNSGTERVNEIAQTLQFDFVVNLQGDEPLMTRRILRLFASRLTEIVDDNSLLTCVANATIEEGNCPNTVKAVLNVKEEALYFSRYPIPFSREKYRNVKLLKHIGIYGFSKKSIARFCSLPMGKLEKSEKLEQLRALEYGMKIHCLRVKYKGFGIDTKEDLEKFRAMVDNIPDI